MKSSGFLFLFCFSGIFNLIADTVPRAIESHTIHHQSVILMQKAEIAYQTDQQQAFVLAREALSLSESFNDGSIVSKANLLIGKIHLLREEFHEAQLCFTKTILTQNPVTDTALVREAHFLNARVFYSLREWDKAIGEILEAQKLTVSGTNTEFVDLNDLMAKTYFNKNEPDSGKLLYDQIIPVLEDSKSYEELGSIYNNLGVHYFNKLDFANALTYYYKSLENNTRANNLKAMSVCHNNIGIIHRKIGNYPEALESFKKALNLRLELGDQRQIAITHNSIGLVYKEMKQYPEAIESFKRSRVICTAPQDYDVLSMVKINLGSVYLDQMQPKEALLLFYEVLPFYLEKSNNQYLATTFNNMASAHLMLHQTDSAIGYAQRAASYAEQPLLIEVQKENTLLLYKIYKRQNNTKAALKFLEKYNLLKDSIDQQLRSKPVEDLSLRLFAQQKSTENQQLNQANIDQQKTLEQVEKLNARQHRYLVLIIIFLVVISMAFILVTLLFIQKRNINRMLRLQKEKEQKQLTEIEFQNSHLSAINRELERLSIIVDKTKNAVSIINVDGEFIWVNQGFIKMYGFTFQEFKELVGSNLYVTAEKAGVRDKVDFCIKHRIPVTYEFLAQCKNKPAVWAQTTLTPLLDKYGQIYQFIAIDTSINKLKKAEIKIRKQHDEIVKKTIALEASNQELKKLSVIAQKTSNAVILIDSKGTIDWVNHSFEKIYGFNQYEIKGKDYKILIQSYVGDEIKKIAQVWFGGRDPVSFESLNKTKSGAPIWVTTSLTPIVNEFGELVNMVAIDTDITKLKSVEQELQRIYTGLTSSISYAKRIQMSYMPPPEMLTPYFADSFIIYKPKDIVSGDFYWFAHINGKTVVVSADCTGHGVPGAFMSLIGITSLNQIVKQQHLLNPSEILNELRNYLISALNQKGEFGETNDGMDISIIVIDHQQYKAHFSGAMSQMFFVSNNEVTTIKGDRASISYDHLTHQYSVHSFSFQPSDLLFLFTDGMIDQFGGPENQKLKTTTLRKFILENHKLPLPEQQKKLVQFFTEWQGYLPQLDDILMIGIHLK